MPNFRANISALYPFSVFLYHLFVPSFSFSLSHTNTVSLRSRYTASRHLVLRRNHRQTTWWQSVIAILLRCHHCRHTKLEKHYCVSHGACVIKSIYEWGSAAGFTRFASKWKTGDAKPTRTDTHKSVFANSDGGGVNKTENKNL